MPIHHTHTRSASSYSSRRGGWRHLLLITILISLSSALPARAAGPAALVLDINATGPNSSSTPQNLLAVGSTAYFTADDGSRGRELWKSDGTQSGTKIVRNISSGASSSSPTEMTDVNGTLFFAATTTISGTELWRSDGTTSGTSIVIDINPLASSAPMDLTRVNQTLFFSADDGSSGRELWKSDGTPENTSMVADLNASAPGASSTPTRLTEFNGAVFFAATDAISGTELWKSDGTPQGTSIITDINTFTPGASSSPASLTVLNGTLFFAADDGLNGIELWKSDGTPAGTRLIKDINSSFPGAAAAPTGLTVVNGTLFFTANDGVSGIELWKSDGTTAGTLRVKDIYPGPADSSPANLTNVNDTLFFTANDGVSGIELWKSDGTAAGTLRVKDIYPGPADSSPADLADAGGTLLFAANDGSTGRELWKSRGSEESTLQVQNIASGTSDANPASITVAGSRVFFAAADDTTGAELWAVAPADLNFAPLARDMSLRTLVNTPTTGALTASDPDQHPLTFSIVQNGGKGLAAITNSATGAFIYTPNVGATGEDSFTFKANDGLADSNVATVAVTISVANDAPVATGGTVATKRNTPATGTLDADDPEGDMLTFSIVQNGGKGVATITNPATGAFTYTPHLNATGEDSFTFKANDGLADSNIATFTIAISTANNAPVASAAAIRAKRNTPLGGILGASDSDGDPLTFSIVQNGGKGIAVITNPSTGAFNYTPQAGATGSDSFTFQVNDGLADSNIATISITIDSGSLYLPLVRK